MRRLLRHSLPLLMFVWWLFCGTPTALASYGTTHLNYSASLAGYSDTGLDWEQTQYYCYGYGYYDTNGNAYCNGYVERVEPWTLVYGYLDMPSNANFMQDYNVGWNYARVDYNVVPNVYGLWVASAVHYVPRDHYYGVCYFNPEGGNNFCYWEGGLAYTDFDEWWVSAEGADVQQQLTYVAWSPSEITAPSCTAVTFDAGIAAVDFQITLAGVGSETVYGWGNGQQSCIGANDNWAFGNYTITAAKNSAGGPWIFLAALLIVHPPPPQAPPEVIIRVNGTDRQDDDITALNSAQVLPVLVQFNGVVRSTINFTLVPPGRANLNSNTLTLDPGQAGWVMLTPLVASALANDLSIEARVNVVNGSPAAHEELTIVQITIPNIRSANTPNGMRDRIPPTNPPPNQLPATPIQIIVQPNLEGTGQSVTIAKEDGETLLLTNPDAFLFGRFSINGGPAVTMQKTATLNFRGTTQTSGSNIPGQYAGHLRAIARVREVEVASSPTFTVAALPIGLTEIFSSLVDDGVSVGFIVEVKVESDSGVEADLLTNIAITEQVEVALENGSFASYTDYSTPYRLFNTGLTDRHSTPSEIYYLTGVESEKLNYQLCLYRSLITGDVGMEFPIHHSGYSIYRNIYPNPNMGPPSHWGWILYTGKGAIPTTVNGFDSEEGYINPDGGPLEAYQ